MKKTASQHFSFTFNFGMGFAAAALLAICLLLRTTGIHCDENNYLNLAVSTPWGDSASMSKPVLFYWLNFKIYHIFGKKLGFLRPISLHLFYAILFAVSLAASTRRFKAKDQFLLFAFLMSSPLILLNTTQLMMESLVFPFTLAATFLCFYTGQEQTKTQSAALVICAAIATAAKMTAIFALAPLSLCIFWRSKKISALVFGGIILGWIFHKAALQWWVHATAIHRFARSEIEFSWIIHRLQPSIIGQYLFSWLWFGGATLLVCCIIAAREILSPELLLRKTQNRILTSSEVLTLTGCLILSLLILEIVQEVPPHADIIRYAYPAFLTGLVISGLYLMDRKPAVLLVLACFQILCSSALFTTDFNRFKSWPSLFQFETPGSGGTAFFGLPVHRLAIALAKKSSPPCLIAGGDQVLGHWTDQYLSFVWPGFGVLSRKQCNTGNIILNEQSIHPSQVREPCVPTCGRASPKWSSCSFQEIVYFSGYMGTLRREFCWLN